MKSSQRVSGTIDDAFVLVGAKQSRMSRCCNRDMRPVRLSQTTRPVHSGFLASDAFENLFDESVDGVLISRIGLLFQPVGNHHAAGCRLVAHETGESGEG